MSGNRYSREFLDWLRKVAPGRTLARIQGLIRARWRMSLSDGQLKALFHNHGIRRFEGVSHKEMCAITTVHEHKFPGLKDWLLSQDVTGTTRAMMLERINEHFGWSMTMSQLKGYLNRNHLALWGIEAGQFRKGHPSTRGIKMSAEQYRKCAATMFKKGNRPKTAVPVGTIVVAKVAKVTNDGCSKEELYYKKKVAEPNHWKLLHRLVWEEHNGPIPRNHVITFLDGNWRNCDISNLMCISRGANCRANQDGLRFEGNPELTKSGLLMSELKTQAIKMEKKLRKGKRRKNKEEENNL